MKQENLKNKCDQLDKSDDEIQKLEKDILKKNQEIDRLQWEVDVLRVSISCYLTTLNVLKFYQYDIIWCSRFLSIKPCVLIFVTERKRCIATKN